MDTKEKAMFDHAKASADKTRARLVPLIVADIKANHGTLEVAQAKGLYRFAEGGGYGEEYEADIRAALA